MSELVDLSKLDAPKVLEDLDFESLLADRKAEFIALFPQDERAFWQARLSLESEPITKLLQEVVYFQLMERNRINGKSHNVSLCQRFRFRCDCCQLQCKKTSHSRGE